MLLMSGLPTSADPAAAGGRLPERLAHAAARVGAVTGALLLEHGEGCEPRLVAAMRHAVLGGGKRLRGFITLESAAICGADTEKAVRVAACIELVHAYSLVHDDLPCLDNSDVRRGQPSVHRAFDPATAVLAGDALLTLAFALLADPEWEPDARIRAELVLELARSAGISGMVGGQALDILPAGAGGMADILHLADLKTGALFRLAAMSGAILTRAPGEAAAALGAYARHLGQAFQITDDLLDHRGNEALAGKPLGKDSAAGKQTCVSLLGAAGAEAKAREICRAAADSLAIFGDRGYFLRALAVSLPDRRA